MPAVEDKECVDCDSPRLWVHPRLFEQWVWFGLFALSFLPTMLHKWLLEGGYKCRVLSFIVFLIFGRDKHDNRVKHVQYTM